MKSGEQDSLLYGHRIRNKLRASIGIGDGEISALDMEIVSNKKKNYQKFKNVGSVAGVARVNYAHRGFIIIFDLENDSVRGAPG